MPPGRTTVTIRARIWVSATRPHRHVDTHGRSKEAGERLIFDEQGRVTGSLLDFLDLLEAVARTALQMSPEQLAEWNTRDPLAALGVSDEPRFGSSMPTKKASGPAIYG